MANRNTRSRSERAVRLALEGLERRDVPTAPALLAGPLATVKPVATQSQVDTADGPGHIPTARERARQRFVARFSGSFRTGPGRFTDQASQVFIKGGGISTAFLHGDVQMAAYTPVAPGTTTTGLAVLIVKNITNSGNLLVLDLQGDTSSLDRAGRPTRFDWTVNGASGGTFSGATGQGTLEVLYRPEGRAQARTGSVGLIFRGSIDTNGVSDILLT